MFYIAVAGFDKYYSEKDNSLNGTSFNDNVSTMKPLAAPFWVLINCLAVEELRSDGKARYT